MSPLNIIFGLLLIACFSGCKGKYDNKTSTKEQFVFSSILKDSLLKSGLDPRFISKSIQSIDSGIKSKDLQKISIVDLVIYDSLVGADKIKLAIAFLDNTLQFPDSFITDSTQYRYYSRTLAFKAYEMEISENFAECKELLEELLLLNKKWKVNNNSIYANLTLGNINTRYGDYNKAVNYLNKCKEESFVKGDKTNYNRACNGLAVAYKYQNRFDLAIENLQKVQDEAELYSKTYSCIELADNFLALHKYPEAKKNVESGRRLVKGLELEDNNDLTAELYSISGAMQKDLGNNDAALSDFNNAVKLKALGGINPVSREFAKLYLNLGTVYFRKSLLRNSMSYINRSLNTFCSIDTASLFSVPTKSQLYSENTILDALDLKAEVLQSLYQQTPNPKYLTTAIQCYTLSFEVEKKLMQYFSYDESKLLMLNESRQRSQKAIALCYQLYQLTKDNQWAQKAFGFAEKNKAFVLLESVKRIMHCKTIASIKKCNPCNCNWPITNAAWPKQPEILPNKKYSNKKLNWRMIFFLPIPHWAGKA
jgi:tetratricopeptide (TPR) repeat protein